ncbi:MAG TPA: hypothetical protein VEI96_07270 [Thermodesulfovibrionales bacterium]|nr:hypothetical protein [Thermodesulfovibrionales bacterium]
MADKKAGRSIAVDAYSGYRGEEVPRSFILSGEKIEVIEILDAGIEEIEGRRKRLFRLRGSDGYVHRISYEEEAKEWFYGT